MGRVVEAIHLQKYAHNLKQKDEDRHMRLRWEKSFSPAFPVRPKFFRFVFTRFGCSFHCEDNIRFHVFIGGVSTGFKTRFKVDIAMWFIEAITIKKKNTNRISKISINNLQELLFSHTLLIILRVKNTIFILSIN